MSTPPPAGSEPDHPDQRREDQPSADQPPEGQPSEGQPSADQPPPEAQSPHETQLPPRGQPHVYPAPQGYPAQGYPPPEGYPAQGYPPPQSYPQQGYSAQGYPPEGYPSGSYPPPQGPAGGAEYPNYPAGYPGYQDAGVEPPENDPLVPAGFGGWFERVLGVVRRSWRTLLIFQAVLAVLSAIYSALAASFSRNMTALSGALGPGFDPNAGAPPDLVAAVVTAGVIALIGWGVLCLVVAFLAPASVFVVIRDAEGQPAPLGEALRFGASRMPAMIGWGLLAWILTSIGFVLLIIPGIYLSIVFGAALIGVVAVERTGIGRCFALVNPRFWPTAGRLVFYFLVVLVYYFIASFIASAIGGGPLSTTTGIVQAILLIPLGIAGVGVTVVTYAELRFRENGVVTTPALAAELPR